MSINWKKFWTVFGGTLALVIIICAIITGIALLTEFVHPAAGVAGLGLVCLVMVALGTSLER